MPCSSKPRKIRQLRVTAGPGSFPVLSPHATGSAQGSGHKRGVSAPGRERRPGGPRLLLVPSPSLPSPAGCSREEGAVGQARAERATGSREAEPLSRRRPEGAGGGQRLRQGHPRVAPASTDWGRQVAVQQVLAQPGGAAGLLQTGPKGPQRGKQPRWPLVSFPQAAPTVKSKMGGKGCCKSKKKKSEKELLATLPAVAVTRH